jgi:hypothetical protein
MDASSKEAHGKWKQNFFIPSSFLFLFSFFFLGVLCAFAVNRVLLIAGYNAGTTSASTVVLLPGIQEN